MKYIVSACLAGVKCRYDGSTNTDDRIRTMVEDGIAIAACPEVLGGLPVPRVRCELQKSEDGSPLIKGEDGKNYTDAFLRGAMLFLKLAEEKGINRAILKSKSPSCGCGSIYDGTFSGKVVEGNGITAEMFIKSGIKVFTENDVK